ncbi:MAG: hypothetical protein D6731_05515 [Planctomycetota bacterium]|nr:MAG: hypothetical protein D6731_05515 [Planctomycetota bacterium]
MSEPSAGAGAPFPGAGHEEGFGAEGLKAWVISCPRHGTRARLHLNSLDSPTPGLRHCSLRPGEMPPLCDHGCLRSFRIQEANSALEGDSDLAETRSCED